MIDETGECVFDNLVNFRDVGGYPADGGRVVATGRLYRSATLGNLRGADEQRFLALGVRTVIDLRYPWEIEARGRMPAYDTVAWHNLSIEHEPYNQAQLGPEIDPGPFLAGKFREVIDDGAVELRAVLDLIAEADNAPVVVHCASGKDRTGIVIALVLALLGVAESDIISDFARTGLATDRLVAGWHAVNPGGELRWPGYGQAPEETMRLFLTDLGSAHDYATMRLGLDDRQIESLRAHLLVEP